LRRECKTDNIVLHTDRQHREVILQFPHNSILCAVSDRERQVIIELAIDQVPEYIWLIVEEGMTLLTEARYAES